MNSFHLSFVIFQFGMEFIISELVFCHNVKKRKTFALGLLLAIGLALFYVMVFPLQRMGVLIHAPLYLVALLFLRLGYDISISVLLFIATACATIGNIGSILSSMVTLVFPQFEHFGIDIAPNWPAYGEMIFFYFVGLGICYLLFLRRIHGFSLQKMATVPIIIFSGGMLIINSSLAMYFELYAAPDADIKLHFLEYIWNLICCIFSLVIQFNIFSNGKKEEELIIAKHLMAERERQYEVSRATTDAINRKCHNLKYQIAAISAGNTGQKELDDALATVESFDSNIHTGNKILDVIFNEKSQYIQQQKITFVCMAEGEKLDFMEIPDLYVLFGNIVDNAIHAVEKLENESSRAVYIDIHAEKSLLLIKTENAYDGEIQFKNGLPRTKTGDDFNHGFGMKSIQMIAEKYEGSLSTMTKNGMFCLNIIIPLNQ